MIQSAIVEISLNSPDYAGLSYEHFEITSLRETPYKSTGKTLSIQTARLSVVLSVTNSRSLCRTALRLAWI